jgi:hypothetical protein
MASDGGVAVVPSAEGGCVNWKTSSQALDFAQAQHQFG